MVVWYRRWHWKTATSNSGWKTLYFHFFVKTSPHRPTIQGKAHIWTLEQMGGKHIIWEQPTVYLFCCGMRGYSTTTQMHLPHLCIACLVPSATSSKLSFCLGRHRGRAFEWLCPEDQSTQQNWGRPVGRCLVRSGQKTYEGKHVSHARWNDSKFSQVVVLSTVIWDADSGTKRSSHSGDGRGDGSSGSGGTNDWCKWRWQRWYERQRQQQQLERWWHWYKWKHRWWYSVVRP